jgi:hypothetical protein
MKSKIGSGWVDAVKENMVLFPEQYTVWFKIILMSFTILEDHKI